MTANRLARPASKLACYQRWLADDVYWPEAQGLALEHLYRALDFLLRHIEALEQELFFRTADLFNADVDLIFWDTTTLYFEIDEEDDDGDVWEDQEIPALRKRGHHKEGRDGNPQVVVGLALTRDGLPVRSWVFPGNTADVTTINHLKADLRGWRLNRCVFVGDSGCSRGQSAAAEPSPRPVHPGGADAQGHRGPTGGSLSPRPLPRGGPQPAVKEVWVGEGERRRRYVVCHNPDEAAREHAHRDGSWSWSERSWPPSTSGRPITPARLRADGLAPLRALPENGHAWSPQPRHGEGRHGSEV